MSRIVALLFLLSTALSAQHAITGYVNLDGVNSHQEIHLTQIALEGVLNYSKVQKVATTYTDENGFFKFKRSLISDKNAIYNLHVNRFEKVLKDTLHLKQMFLLSDRDSIHFKKSKILFSDYINTNLADQEWQKLRNFELQLRKQNLKEEDSLSVAYVSSLKTYTKDSLEILLVKLIGIKQLDNKALLERDIAKNPRYYTALLTELKESEIERSEYLFLENKLAFLTTEVAENKYTTSKSINILLGLVVMGLLFLAFWKKRPSLVISDLSKQEKNIQGLIVQGKTNKEIANELFISLSTVKTHITNIYSKLQVSSRKELLQKSQNS